MRRGEGNLVPPDWRWCSGVQGLSAKERPIFEKRAAIRKEEADDVLSWVDKPEFWNAPDAYTCKKGYEDTVNVVTITYKNGERIKQVRLTNCIPGNLTTIGTAFGPLSGLYDDVYGISSKMRKSERK